MALPQSVDDHLLHALATACDRRIITLPAPMSLICHYPNDQHRPFKSNRFKGNEDFLLEGVRLGRREPIIVKLKPIDAVDFAHAEVESGKIAPFQEIEAHLVEALGTYLHEQQKAAGVTDLDAPFIGSSDTLNRAIGTLRGALEPILKDIEAARIAAAEAEQAKAYEDNEEWGSW